MLEKKRIITRIQEHMQMLSMTDLTEDIQPQMSLYYLLN